MLVISQKPKTLLKLHYTHICSQHIEQLIFKCCFNLGSIRQEFLMNLKMNLSGILFSNLFISSSLKATKKFIAKKCKKWKYCKKYLKLFFRKFVSIFFVARTVKNFWCWNISTHFFGCREGGCLSLDVVLRNNNFLDWEKNM